MEQSAVEKRLAEVLETTERPFEASFVGGRVVVAIEIRKDVFVVGYITPDDYSQLIAQSKMLSYTAFEQKYARQLYQKVLSNYETLMEYIAANSSAQKIARRGRKSSPASHADVMHYTGD